MIISGNKIARALRDELKGQIVCEGFNPSHMALHIFIVGENPVIENFVMKKREFAKALGVDFIEYRFNKEVSQDELMANIEQISKKCPREHLTSRPLGQVEHKCGVVVQLPLPSHINTQTILDSVPAHLDVDGLGTSSTFREPVAGAVQEILERKNIEVAGKKALVIGKGALVGEPVARLLRSLGAVVSVADISTTTEELTVLCKESDIIVSGAGVPNLIQPEMIKEGAALLDAGTSTRAGSVVGDIAYECKDVARYFARTPGGIGPVTVAVLFKNLLLGSNK